jgi:DNA-binding XRE family transcriptional regulator
MSKVQVIEADGKPVFYVVPAELWERMRAVAEEAEDVADLVRFDRDDDGIRIPVEVVKAMRLDGAHPVKAWREHKGLTLQALADAAGVSKAYVSQIEGGKRTGTAATLKKLAAALGVPVSLLLPA